MIKDTRIIKVYLKEKIIREFTIAFTQYTTLKYFICNSGEIDCFTLYDYKTQSDVTLYKNHIVIIIW